MVTSTHAQCLALAALVLLTLLAPTHSQIHWNRGWGAGGSVGKRSSSTTSSSSSSSSLPASFSRDPDCRPDVVAIASLVSRVLENEVNQIVSCQLKTRLLAAEVVSEDIAAAQDTRATSGLPSWWSAQRKMAPQDQ